MELNHVATFVSVLDDSIVGPALSEWGTTFEIVQQPAMVNGIPTEFSGRTRRVMTSGSLGFGMSIEEMEPGAPITPEPDGSWHHVAVWCESLTDAVETLERHGFVKDVVGRDADGNLDTFAYLTAPGWPRLELSEMKRRPGWVEHIRATGQDDDAGDGSDGLHGRPLVVNHVAAAVADDAELDAFTACMQDTFGTTWSAARDTATMVRTPDGDRELATRTMRSSGNPSVTVVVAAPHSRPLISPGERNGWHHVGIESRDVTGDLASLEEMGFLLEYRDVPRDSGVQFAMLRSPEGLRVELSTPPE